MAAVETILGEPFHIVGLGYGKCYKIVLSGGDTSCTLADTSWVDVKIVFPGHRDGDSHEAAADTNIEAWWDGSDVKFAGYTANTTFYPVVIGTF